MSRWKCFVASVPSHVSTLAARAGIRPPIWYVGPVSESSAVSPDLDDSAESPGVGLGGHAGATLSEGPVE